MNNLKKKLYNISLTLLMCLQTSILYALGTDITTNYIYSTPQVINHIKGVGIGPDISKAYCTLRSEDISFLTEAYTELNYTINRGLKGLPLAEGGKKEELPIRGFDSYAILSMSDNWPPFEFLKELKVDNTSTNGFITESTYLAKETGVVKTDKKEGTLKWICSLFPLLNNSKFIEYYLEETVDGMRLKQGIRPKLNRICKYYNGLQILHSSHYLMQIASNGVFDGTNTVYVSKEESKTNYEDITKVLYNGYLKKWKGYKTSPQSSGKTEYKDKMLKSVICYENGYTKAKHKRKCQYDKVISEDPYVTIKDEKETDIDLEDEKWNEIIMSGKERYVNFGNKELLEYGNFNHLKECELYGLIKATIVTNEIRVSNGVTNSVKSVNKEDYYIVQIPTNDINCASIIYDGEELSCRFKPSKIKNMFQTVFPLIAYDEDSVKSSCPSLSPETPQLCDNDSPGTTTHQYTVHAALELMDLIGVFKMRYMAKMKTIEQQTE